MIETQDLYKRYGDRTVLTGLSLSIPKGEVCGLLGQNGAGKTTTMRILTTALQPTSGRVLLNGIDAVQQPHEIRKIVGYLPEKPPLYGNMKVGEFLHFVGNMRSVQSLSKQVGLVLEQTGLLGRENQRIQTLSKGFQQRVGIAQAILHQPEVLILDEPASGLDPSQLVEIRKLLRSLAEERTVLLSTHQLTEAEQICSYNALLHKGTLSFAGHHADWVERFGGRYWSLYVQNQEEIDAKMTRLATEEWVKKVVQNTVGNTWDVVSPEIEDLEATHPHQYRRYDVYTAMEDVSTLWNWCQEAGVRLFGLHRQVPSLESCFLATVGAEQ